jgi:hypothetical protein
VLLVERRHLADGPLPRLGEVEEDTDAEVLAGRQIHAGAGGGLAISQDRLLGHRGGAAADDALDAVLDHEVQAPRAGADDGLPALHGTPERAGHQREPGQLVTAIGDGRRQRVVLAVMREGLLVEGLHDDVDLLLEDLPVGLGVEHGTAQRLDLARVVAAAHAEDHAPAREDVGHGEVLGQPERVPHGRDVEAAPEAQPLGHVSQVHGVHQDVGDDLVALVLEVVLGQPQRVVAQVIHGPGQGVGLLEHRGQVLIGVPALVGRGGVLAEVSQIHVSGVERRELGDHGRACPPPMRSVRARCSMLA